MTDVVASAPDERTSELIRDWTIESSAAWAPGFYGGTSGTPLNDSATSSNPSWHPVNTTTYPNYGFFSSLGSVDISFWNWQVTSTRLVNGGLHGRFGRTYAANVFWQYLAEQSLSGDQDLHEVFLGQLDSLSGSQDLIALLEDVAETEIGTPFDEILGAYWMALHVLSDDNDDVEQLDWNHPASDTAKWREHLAASDFVNVHADTFGSERANSSEHTVDAEGSFQINRTIEPGAAVLVDVIPEPQHSGDLEVTIQNQGASEPLVATVLAYDADAHPNICVRDNGGPDPELDQWSALSAPETGSVVIDSACRTASVAVVHTDPYLDQSAVDVEITVEFTSTTPQSWGNSVVIDGPSATGIGQGVALRVIPSDFADTDCLEFNFTVSTGAGFFVGVQTKIWLDGNQVHSDSHTLTPSTPNHPISPTPTVSTGLPSPRITATVQQVFGTVNSWAVIVTRC